MEQVSKSIGMVFPEQGQKLSDGFVRRSAWPKGAPSGGLIILALVKQPQTPHRPWANSASPVRLMYSLLNRFASFGSRRCPLNRRLTSISGVLQISLCSVKISVNRISKYIVIHLLCVEHVSLLLSLLRLHLCPNARPMLHEAFSTH